MSGAQRYRVNAPQVVHQTIDGEVVIINLEHGYYYSLTESGADAWAALAAGGSLADAATDVAAAYDAERDAIDDALSALVVELEREGLLIPDGARGEGVVASTPAADRSAEAGCGRRPFTAPVLQKFSDMQELLLLDPIHEVDETGWPSVKKDAA